MKKLIALLLACMMVIGLFAACTNNPAEPTKPEDTTTAPADDTTPDDTTPETTEPEEIVDLIWYQVGNGPAANLASWTEKVNAYLVPKIGVRLDLRVIGWGDWENKSNMITTTGEEFDLLFTNGSGFVKNVRMGAFADISELINTTPGLTELIPSEYLDACRVDGKLYGIPCYKDSSMTNYFVWDKEVVDQYYPEYKDAHTMADVEAGLYAIKEGTGKNPIQINRDGWGGAISGNKYDAAGIGDFGVGIAYNGGTEFVPVFEQPEVMAELKLLNKWYNDGLINSDAAQVEGQPEGRFTVGVAQGWPAAAGGWGQSRGCEVVVSQMEKTVLSNDTVLGSVTAISANCEHPEKALQLLELVNTDTYLRDMLWYGEEGVNYNYIDADQNVVPYTEGGEQWALRDPANNWTAAAYTQGTFFVATPEAQRVKVLDENGEETGEENIVIPVGNPYVDEIMPLNASATPSPAIGFSFAPSEEVANLIANCTAVFKDYRALIFTGAADPEDTVAEMMSALRDSGFDDILAEINTQYAAWVAGK